jgi:class 3 adenylate cyclase
MMPEMDGYQVLEHLKADVVLRHVPVIVISALDEIDSAVRCIELGAEDYLTKPFNRVILRARVGASLEKKRLRDQEQAYLQELQSEREKSEQLLLNILPKPIAQRLKQGERRIADHFDKVSILFADVVDFTPLSAQMAPAELVDLLNAVFCSFDQLVERHGLEKIKTVGDAYMVASGLLTSRPDHAGAIADLALDMQSEMGRFRTHNGSPLDIRIGIDTGSVVAGVIGESKFSYDLWGDAVNTASRMQTHTSPGCIQVTEATYRRLEGRYILEARGTIEVKGKGKMKTYLLKGKAGPDA